MCVQNTFTESSSNPHIRRNTSVKTMNDIKFCFWNVGGIVHDGLNKMDDDMFLSEIKCYDIIMLAETHISYNTPLVLQDFNYYPICRPKSGNGRYFGGLAIFVRKSIKPYVSILKNTHKDFQWLKFDKSFFHLKRDLYLCLVYDPPAQSIYTKNLPTDILQLLENDIVSFKSKGDVLLCGDFNARCGNLPDFIVSDSADHLPVDNDCYAVDFMLNNRYSKDTTIDSRGKELIELCIGNQLRLLNGRIFGDSSGKFTCHTPMGNSIVDYVLASDSLLQDVLYFNVSPFNPILSDCHCKLSWKILSHFNINHNDNTTLRPMKKIFMWGNSSASDFQSALLSDDIQTQIMNFKDNTEASVSTLSEKLNVILLSAVYSCLIRPPITRKKSKLRRNHKNFFDKDLYKMRQNVVSYARTFSKYPFDPFVHGRFFKLLRQYNRSRKYKKRKFREDILNQLDNLEANNPQSYWDLVKKN